MAKKTMLIWRDFLMTLVSGSLGSIVLGLMLFQMKVFDPGHPGFQFIVLGIAGSTCFALFKSGRLRDGLFAAVLIFVLQIVILQLNRFSLIVTLILFYAMVVFGAYLHAKSFFPRLKNMPVARPLTFSSLLAIGFVMVSALLWLLYNQPGGTANNLMANMPVGFLIGLGMGIGFEIAEKAAGR